MQGKKIKGSNHYPAVIKDKYSAYKTGNIYGYKNNNTNR